MSLSSVVLTSFTGAYYLDCVSHGSRPVKALSKCVSDKSVWHCVVAVDAPMEVL
jgi:hypothetical protein